MADLRLIADGAGSGSFDTNATAFLADGALLAALHGCLTLADGDGDGIPFSTRDRIMIDRRFHLLLLEPGAEDPTNDLRPILEDTLLAWETGMALLRRLFSRDPAWDRQGSTFRKLYTNLVTLRSNTTAILQTLEAGP
jgi:hypothetical protein